MTAITNPARRYDLDWLRVIAFGLLIFYHIGMYYVTWDWHVKSPHAGHWAEPAMMLLNPWRLSLLFFISGVAFRFAADKAPAGAFARKRFLRLFVPVAFGMAVIVTPQSYFELLTKGEITPGYLDFWVRYLAADSSFSIIVPTWNHLWYVVYLLVYSLVAIALMPVLRQIAAKLEGGSFEALMGRGGILLVPLLPFILYRFTLDEWFPTTHALVDDWNAHANYFTIFAFGILVAKSDAFWRVLARSWRACLCVAVALGAILTPVWVNWDALMPGHDVAIAVAHAVRVLYAWAAILSLLGFAQAHLNRPHPMLGYFTRAVFPYYILHQTIIVIAAVWLSGFGLSAPAEFIALVTLTTLGCGLGYHYLIRPFPLIRPLFGVFGEAPRPKPAPTLALDSSVN
ncbi:acyltransferase family protein [Pseudokordiimonas caeni]|uniref:acyltransferase family protein n=1 Tax=Pseudokordiimonas caeni TaxID=2997908 RepID=UPI002811EA41|nr:acyltransferase family protein [Pseudokordiimonas caeni]